MYNQLNTAIDRHTKDIRVLLHNIRSAYNVGAMLRTSDAAGVARVYFSGYTPQPLDRFGRPVHMITKTALGAEHYVPWEGITDPGLLIAELRRDGFVIIGLEQDIRSLSYRAFHPAPRMLLLVGNEVEGLSKTLRDACDTLIEIPMRGILARERTGDVVGKESLNVSVAFGIAVFQLCA